MELKQKSESKRWTPRARDYLNGQSPHLRASQKREKCLTWIYRWGFSSGSTLSRVAGVKQSVSGKMEKAGLIIGTKTEAGGITRGTPSMYYTLTETGQEEAERQAPELLRYREIDRYRVNQKTLRHDLMAQQATLGALQSGAAVGFLTERELGKEQVGCKHPDVIWLLPGGGRIGIEVELSAKWERRLDEFVLAIYRSLREDGTPAAFDRVAVVTDSRAIKERYRGAMSPGTRVAYWSQDSRGHWKIEGKIELPPWMIEKVDFVLIEE
jgi:hypothetical protein